MEAKAFTQSQRITDSRDLESLKTGVCGAISYCGDGWGECGHVGLTVSWRLHLVFHVSLSLLAEEEPRHLKRAPSGQDPVAEDEHIIEAILAHRG